MRSVLILVLIKNSRETSQMLEMKHVYVLFFHEFILMLKPATQIKDDRLFHLYPVVFMFEEGTAVVLLFRVSFVVFCSQYHKCLWSELQSGAFNTGLCQQHSGMLLKINMDFP